MRVSFNRPVLFIAAVAALAVHVAGCNPQTPGAGGSTGAAAAAAADPVAALEGGTPLPEGAGKLLFRWIGKQSVGFISDAEERIAGNVDFSTVDGEPTRDWGTMQVDADGKASGKFTIPVAALRTGNTQRDSHLRGDQWLDAGKFPEITFTVTGATRVKPTVWKISGDWTMHGVTKPITFPANVRHIKEFPGIKNAEVARVGAEFAVSLREHGVTNPYVGGPVVKDAWLVQLALLGEFQK